MKTKNIFTRLAVLATVVIPSMLGGCTQPDDGDDLFILNDGLRINSGTLFFKSEFDQDPLPFSFCDNDGDCMTPAESRDEITLLPDRKYECVFIYTGVHIIQANLKVSITAISGLNLTITKSNLENQLFEGQVTEWLTGGETSGEIELSVVDRYKGSYTINVPVKIATSFNYD